MLGQFVNISDALKTTSFGRINIPEAHCLDFICSKDRQPVYKNYNETLHFHTLTKREMCFGITLNVILRSFLFKFTSKSGNVGPLDHSLIFHFH